MGMGFAPTWLSQVSPPPASHKTTLTTEQKQRGLRGLLCDWPSITEWEMHITAQGCRLRNDLYCVEWDVKLYYTIPFTFTVILFIC